MSDELGMSLDIEAQRREGLLRAIRQAVPDLVREDGEKGVDLNALRALLENRKFDRRPETGDRRPETGDRRPETGDRRPETRTEFYTLNWLGKSAARREILRRTPDTLRPFSDKITGVIADHALIEGDNFDVLRILQKSYYGQIKMIYIDPPYNTGNDGFVYPDNFRDNKKEYEILSGARDQDGLVRENSAWRQNKRENGHFHSAWLSMMYPRLFLARNLLRDDGVIFISIDDNEQANLKLLCDEIFGQENFVANVIWQKKFTVSNDAKYLSNTHDHILIFARNKETWRPNRLARTEVMNRAYTNPDNDPRGAWMSTPLTAKSGTAATRSDNFFHTFSNGITWRPNAGRYSAYTSRRLAAMEKEGLIYFGKSGEAAPSRKLFFKDILDKGPPANTIWGHKEVGNNASAKAEIVKIFDGFYPFDTPKPTTLLKRILKIATHKDAIVLDFFAGSGTLAHAVMELNAEDGGNRKSISVQIAEPLDEKSEAYKSGYQNIAEITRARIGKAAAKIKAEHEEVADKNPANFACVDFKLASSNFKVWQSKITDIGDLEAQLEIFQAPEILSGDKAAKTAQECADILTELLLKYGLGLPGFSAFPREVSLGDGLVVYEISNHDDKVLWIFLDAYTPLLKEAIFTPAKDEKNEFRRPAKLAMLNSCFAGDKADEALANLELELKAHDIEFELI